MQQSVTRSHHVNLVDIEPGPGQMAHKLYEHDGEEQRPHGPGVISVIMHWSDKFGDILTYSSGVTKYCFSLLLM